MGSGLSIRLGNQRPATAGTFGAWSPANVPQVAAGYWWTAADATGAGTVLFKVPEGGAHTTFDLIQAVVANQPTVLTELGGTQFRMRRQADANPSSHRTAAPVQAGWTGATYVGMWLRLPDASGDITATSDTWFSHNNTSAQSNGRIIIFPATTGGDGISTTLNQTGVGGATSRNAHVTPFVGAGWHWCEFAFDPALVLGGITTADRNKAFSDLTALVRYVTESVGTTPTTIFDAIAAILVACNASTAVTDTTDWATCYYANGIPSLANREALRRHLAPV